MDAASLFFGLFVGVFVFAVAKAIQQTRSIYKHTGSFNNTYLYLVWGETFTNLSFAIITILYLSGVYGPSLWFFVLTVVLWSTQVELLPQIIANRVALIMTNRRKAKMLKWGLAAAITPVCLSVNYIWVVAHLPGSTPEQRRLNMAYENFEKTFFLVIDLALNIYFLHLVRHRLIARGLTKYWKLYNFNMGMVAISTTLDILLLGFLSLPNPYVYVQFAPFVYTCKLYIELVMARLISKVVRSSAGGRDGEDLYGSNWAKTHAGGTIVNVSAGGKRTTTTMHHHNGNSNNNNHSTLMSKLSMHKAADIERDSSSGSDIQLTPYREQPHGITKTTETTIQVDDGDGSLDNGVVDFDDPPSSPRPQPQQPQQPQHPQPPPRAVRVDFEISPSSHPHPHPHSPIRVHHHAHPHSPIRVHHHAHAHAHPHHRIDFDDPQQQQQQQPQRGRTFATRADRTYHQDV